MDLELADKVALIAGSSRGIGFATAQCFLREGANVIITARGERTLAEARQALEEAAGPSRVVAVRADMTTPEGAGAAVAAALEQFGRIDAVVANVGNGHVQPGWDIDEAQWISVLNTNLTGATAVARCAIPHLKVTRGSLLFVSSIAGLEATGAPMTYSAAKASIGVVVKCLSRLLGADGVRVNAVAPGNVLFSGSRWEQRISENPDEVQSYIRSEVPLRRFASPNEIAASIVFLSSPCASFISGACLVIDGGQTRSFF
jgi:3-oxoacyl-[acyl-carrier protein] reductase